MPLNDKAKEEIVDTALGYLAYIENPECDKAPYVTARQVWGSMTTTKANEYVTIQDIEVALKEAGFHSRYNGIVAEFTLKVSG